MKNGGTTKEQFAAVCAKVHPESPHLAGTPAQLFIMQHNLRLTWLLSAIFLAGGCGDHIQHFACSVSFEIDGTEYWVNRQSNVSRSGQYDSSFLTLSPSADVAIVNLSVKATLRDDSLDWLFPNDNTVNCNGAQRNDGKERQTKCKSNISAQERHTCVCRSFFTPADRKCGTSPA